MCRERAWHRGWRSRDDERLDDGARGLALDGSLDLRARRPRLVPGPRTPPPQRAGRGARHAPGPLRPGRDEQRRVRGGPPPPPHEGDHAMTTKTTARRAAAKPAATVQEKYGKYAFGAIVA